MIEALLCHSSAGTTFSARLGGLCATYALSTGAADPAAGLFSPYDCPMVPDPDPDAVYDWRADPDFDPSVEFYDDDPDIEVYYAALEADEDDPYLAEQRAEEAVEGIVPRIDDDESEQDVELLRHLAWERYCLEVGLDPAD